MFFFAFFCHFAIFLPSNSEIPPFYHPSVTVEGCSTFPCLLKKGQNSTIHVQGVSYYPIDVESTISVHGKFPFAEIPFPLPQGNKVCGFGMKKCPVAKDESFEYDLSLAIRAEWPSISVLVKMEMFDGKKERDFCILIPVKIV
eukprot:Sdes_comp19658_c0_seq2m11484